MRKFIKLTAMLASVCLIAVLVLGWLQTLHPAFDSLSHFRLHFAGLLLALTLGFLLAKMWKRAFVSVFVIATSLFLSSPYLPIMGPQELLPITSPSGIPIRVVQMNLRFNNQESDRAISVLKNAKADILLLQEVTLVTERVLTSFKNTHPYQVSCQKRGVGSVAIVSRYPFADDTSQKCARFFGYASAKILIDGQKIDLASFHSRWPWPSRQSRQITQLESEFEKLGQPLILAGDFNAAPWSAAVRRVADITHTRIVPGLKLTWAPRFVEFKTTIGALLPIDHILISPRFRVHSRKVLNDGGSDHFPVLTELRLTKQ